MVATPPEKIARQHAKACHILDTGSMTCLPCIDYGEIPLHWKARRTLISSSLLTSSKSIGTSGRTSATADNRVGGGSLRDRDIGVGKIANASAVVVEGVEIHPPPPPPLTGVEELRYCISSHGHIDVMPIVELILEGIDDPLAEAGDGCDDDDGATATSTTMMTPSKKKDGTMNGMKKNGSVRRTIATAGGKKTFPASSKKVVNATKEGTTRYSSKSLWNKNNVTTNNVRLTHPSHQY
ncbi:hypothetical protein ACHAXA_003946 [Cyclostephanos tholiformis]|uniref:Uncharacterized protein n=1 Tax=Cyclostephanos tholiformis TaxID=382380 RepID=A0ABD3RYN8_9STRA